MAVTFIEYQNNKGFYIHEDFMQLAFFYIYEEMRKPNYQFSHKSDLLYDCEAIINGHRSSYLVLNWDDFLVNTPDVQLMIELLENAVMFLQKKGSYISVSELQNMPHTGRTLAHDYGSGISGKRINKNICCTNRNASWQMDVNEL